MNGPGGLFDINATLPLVAAQFLVLMVILNIILYNPLLNIIEERKDYILTNLVKAAEMISQANELTKQYEQELENVQKKVQAEIINSQKFHKEVLENELDISQNYLDNLLKTITKDLLDKKAVTLNNMDQMVQSLCTTIEVRLSI
jgi:F-type H+-transporting ATPase subunit b